MRARSRVFAIAACVLAAPLCSALEGAAAPEHAAVDLPDGLDAFEEAVQGGAELVCYAELAFEPFYPQRPTEEDPRNLAQEVPGPVTEAFAKRAAEHGVVVVVNLYERDGDSCFDSSPVIDADGTLLGRARMVHITDYPCFHEQDYYTPGDTGAPVFDTRVGRCLALASGISGESTCGMCSAVGACPEGWSSFQSSLGIERRVTRTPTQTGNRFTPRVAQGVTGDWWGSGDANR